MEQQTISNIFKPLSAPNTKALEYPFSFIGDKEYQYAVSDFCKGIIHEEPHDPGNFPLNIEEYYWIHEGKNDEESWYCLCKLDNGLYAFYSARCDYTGFDCQGEMRLCVSKDLSILFKYGLTTAKRKLCINEKKI
jgi:hypothetical protein